MFRLLPQAQSPPGVTWQIIFDILKTRNVLKNNEKSDFLTQKCHVAYENILLPLSHRYQSYKSSINEFMNTFKDEILKDKHFDWYHTFDVLNKWTVNNIPEKNMF